jgi:RNA polymerase sigma-70 factor, ECF subfamily
VIVVQRDVGHGLVAADPSDIHQGKALPPTGLKCDAQAVTADVYDRYSRMVFNVCLRSTGNLQAAEDCTQETFLTFFKKARILKSHGNLSGWFYRTAILISSVSVRAAGRRERGESAGGQYRAANESLAPDPVWNRIRSNLDAEVDGLSEIYRAPVVKVYLEGRTQCEVAKELNIPPGTLRRRLTQAIKLLRDRLDDDRNEFSPALLIAVLQQYALDAAIPATLNAKIAASAGTAALGVKATTFAGGAMTTAAAAKLAIGVSLLALAGVLIVVNQHPSTTIVPTAAVTTVVPALPVSPSPLPQFTSGIREVKLPVDSPWKELDAQAVAQTKAGLTKKAADANMRLVVVGPWYLITELPEERMNLLVDKYILTIASVLKAEQFANVNPRKPIPLYLFENHQGFNSRREKLFGSKLQPFTELSYAHATLDECILNMKAGNGLLLGVLASLLCKMDAPNAPRWVTASYLGLYSNASVDPTATKLLGVAYEPLWLFTQELKKDEAMSLDQLLHHSGYDFVKPTARTRSLFNMSVSFLQWLQCQGYLSAFYRHVKAKKPAIDWVNQILVKNRSLESVEKEFRAWATKAIADRHLEYRHNNKSFIFELRNFGVNDDQNGAKPLTDF